MLEYFTLIAQLGLSASLPSQIQTSLDDSGLPDAVIEQRLRFLENRLQESKTQGQIWSYSWLAINGVSMVGLGAAAALADNDDDRVKDAAYAANAGIGLAYMLVTPLEARLGASLIVTLPERTREQKLAKLRAAEDQLRRNAERAETRWGLWEHVGNIALNVAAGAATGLAAGPKHGVDVALTGFIGGLAFLLTQPSKPAKDWEAYQNLTGEKTSNVEVFVNSRPDGATLNMRFQW
ncbi:hypothetical protein [Nitrococcus mobilis]|uniref:Uncharacterized protein n=1 Tax=Nitrococcus mobilis Nb-231 TaxID=314278 RepID=A4BS72_9GAMM|nr:hypothetical protein [Nitrococcus mobilis]EAR21551.1 hypothetical protein NB231_01534 [Nitrococcus mobilis Nb-231]